MTDVEFQVVGDMEGVRADTLWNHVGQHEIAVWMADARVWLL